MIKRPISEQDQWIVDTNNAVTGIAPAGTGKETTLVSATTDAVTGRVGLNASGVGLPVPIRRSPVTVAIFGDSWTNACCTKSGTRVDNNMLGYFTHLKQLLAGKVTLVGEFGYSGYKAQNIEQFVPSVMAANADVNIYECGTNDVFAMDAIADVIAAEARIISALTATGKPLVVLGIPPRTDAISNVTMYEYARQLDSAKALICAANPNAYYVNLYSVLSNPTSGDWVAGLGNVDGVHPIALGAQTVARAMLPAFGDMCPPALPILTKWRDASNICINNSFAGSNATGTKGFVLASGGTGSGPDGYRMQSSGGSISAVVSSVTRPATDLRAGNCVQFAVTGDGTGANAVQLQYRALTAAWTSSTGYVYGASCRPTVPNGYRYVNVGGNGTSSGPGSEPTWPTNLGATVTDNSVTWMCVVDFNPGQYVKLRCEYAPDSFNGNFDLQATIQAVNESSSILFTSGDMATAFDVSTQPTFGSAFQPEGILETLPMLIPAGTTRLYFTVGVRAPSGVTGNIKFKAIEARIVAADVPQAT